MPPEEFQNRPAPGRQPRPRGRAYLQNGYGRGDYAQRPAINRAPTSLPPTILAPIPQPVAQPVVEPTPPALTPVPQSVEKPPAPAPQEPTARIEPVILDFKPPVKEKTQRKLKVRKPSLNVSRPIRVFVAIVAVCMVITGIVYWQSNQVTNNEQVLREALSNALTTKQFHAEITGATKASLDYDVSDALKPLISSTETVLVAGLPTQLVGYGSVTNTYISYKDLPPTVAPVIKQSIVNNWIQMRTKNVPAVGAPSGLARTSNPRYHVFGLVLHGNLTEAPRKEIVDYMISRIIYDYVGTKPAKDEIDDKKAIRFDITPNIGELKVVNQSLATQMQLSADDIQDVIADIDRYKGAKTSIFVGAKSKRIERVESTKNGQETTIVYSAFNRAQIAAEPQTNLTWQSFAPTQFQLAAQIAAKQKPDVLDAQRKNNLSALKSALNQYFILTNSYPSLSNINDQTWIAANLPSVDPEVLRDPLSNIQAVLPNPKNSVLAYQPQPLGGKGFCANTGENPCISYRFISTLSNGQQHIVQSP